MDKDIKPVNPLWTKDFTIITIGSIISMLGSTLSGFAMSLLVLDYTGSTFLFALYNVLYFLPSLVVPVLCGPFLDRFSRKRTIYTLDFITAGLFVAAALICHFNWMSFPVIAVFCVILGVIGSMYQVAYESFYPMLITEGNYQKAYSVASTLETMTMVMVPLSAFIYDRIGITLIFVIDAASYFVAAVMETRIGAVEKYVEERRIEGGGALKKLAADFREGMSYLWVEKGLFAVTVYFACSSFAGGVSGALTLPYFQNTFKNGKYVYMLVWGMNSVARAIGGGIHYKKRLPPSKKYSIAFAVYIIISVLEGGYLYCPVRVMMVMCFATGILGVTSYTIRISATQGYVPDAKKGRFHGAFNTLNTAGLLLGELIAGALAEYLPIRPIITVTMALNVLAVLAFIGAGKKHIEKIYNTEN